MDRFLRFAIPTMFAGIALALLYAVFSASSKGSNRDPVAKLAVGALSKLDTSDKGTPAPPAPFDLRRASRTGALRPFARVGADLSGHRCTTSRTCCDEADGA